jgi:ribulose-5-phosphate 4-epimerase/fuculose-1-phosphate aldolase
MNSFEGIVLEEYEGLHIAQALGNKKAMILQNHGLLTASGSVEATIFWFVSLERLCHTQLLALAAVGGNTERIVEVNSKVAAKYYPIEDIYENTC